MNPEDSESLSGQHEAEEDSASIPKQPDQDDPVDEVAHAVSSESQPISTPQAPAFHADAQASAQDLSRAPGLPAMPGEAVGDVEDLDDDDFEIPDEVGYDAIVKESVEPKPAAREQTSKLIRGLVVGKRHDGVFVDIGRKSEAFLPIEPSSQPSEPFEVGQSIEVIVTGQSPEGYPLLSSLNTQRPQGWRDLEAAFSSGSAVIGKVLGTIKGGLSVDVGVRAFMPASRSGEKTEEGMAALVGQQIRARILQFDEADRNVVLDRRAILDQERAAKREETLAQLNVGDRVRGTVRTLLKFGAFVDLGGIDGLLHVSDIAWRRVNDPADFLHRGQEIEVEVLKVDRKLQRIGVGLKQLQPEPWSAVGDSIKINSKIRGKVLRIKEYGAFVEVLPGVEGLVHVSDMSYARRVRHPSEIVSVGDEVEVMVMEVKVPQKRITLGLKQALGDPWQKVGELHPVGSSALATVRKITSFGAFVEILEGVDGLLHISDITSERRLNTPSEVLREGQQVRVKILEMDIDRRRLKVGMKQLEPTETEVFLSQVEVGETVTGRVVKVEGKQAIVEIGDGVRGICSLKAGNTHRKGPALGQTSDLSSLKTMLESAWKGDSPPPEEEPSAVALTKGSVHSFKIKRLDAASGTVELAQT